MDALGVRRTVRPDAVDAVLRALRADDATPPPVRRRSASPAPACHLPRGLRTWGWVAQLYALRSRDGWGIGDLEDLRRVGAWAARHGAGVLMVNPLHAASPGLPQEPSPYFPSSRMYRNLLYLRIERIRGASDESLVAQLAARAQALNERAVIDRDRIYELKLHALEALWERFGGDGAFEKYCDEEGSSLELFATHCVLAEKHQGPWSRWPQDVRRPAAPGVHAAMRTERRRVDFHRWVQWQLDMQYRRAAAQTGLINDLAVGFSPDGADAWMWQDCVAFGARIGAPPDEFNLDGQDWGLPPFDPHRLRAAGYAPFRETLRRAMRDAAGVRIDHVMGLFRLWWIPPGAGGAKDGAYVRYPADELLDVVAEESRRARCFLIGEDLGTVEEGVREEMRRRRMLSYRLAWFEDRAPRRFPVAALAALTTHDLGTVAGVWTRADLEDMRASGVTPNDTGEEQVRERLRKLSGAADSVPVRQVVERAYAALARAPSRIVTATLDDAALAERRPNLPGATARPNWSIPLPRTLEQLQRDALPRRIAAALGGDR